MASRWVVGSLVNEGVNGGRGDDGWTTRYACAHVENSDRASSGDHLANYGPYWQSWRQLSWKILGSAENVSEFNEWCKNH